MKKYLLTVFLFATFMRYGMAQTEWENHYSSPDVEINYSYLECHDEANDVHKRLIIFQFVNLTDNQLSVSFDKQTWYGDKCTGCDRSPERQFTLKLAPHQTLTGSCDKKVKALYIVEKMLNTESIPLTKFNLADVNVSKTE